LERPGEIDDRRHVLPKEDSFNLFYYLNTIDLILKKYNSK
jgi:hypothetical protein